MEAVPRGGWIVKNTFGAVWTVNALLFAHDEDGLEHFRLWMPAAGAPDAA